MPSIRFDGLATGLQTSSLVEALLDFERRPLSLMEARQNEVEARRDLFRTLNTNILALSDAAKALDNQNSLVTGPTLDEEFLEFKASSSDESFVSATATGDASPGSLEVRVDALAQVGRQLSFGFGTASEIVALEGETLSIEFGGASPIDITVGVGGASLQDLKDLVNGDPNNAGKVRADVLFDGSTHRLVLAGTETGAANDLVVTTNVSGPGGTGPLLDASLAQVASDAQLQVLGLSMTRASNVIDDLFGGVTLELHAAHDPLVPADVTTIEVARDDAAIEEKLQALVDSYNTVRRFANDQFRYDEASESGGILSGDSSLRAIDLKLQRVLGDGYSFADSPFSSIGQIGLRFEESGELSLDGKKLRAALAQDTTAVRQLLAGDGTTDGVATALAKQLELMTDIENGVFVIRDEGFDAQIAALDQSIERFERRLAQREELLIERFSRLESLISGLQAQGNYVASAFTNFGN